MKKLIKKTLNKFGIELHRFHQSLNFEAQIVAAMKKIKINTLFDIGANTGQFSLKMRDNGYSGKIISFEPLTSAREKLIHQSSKDENWIVHEKAAIGDYNWITDINISKNSVSSSILPMLKSHLKADKDSKYIKIEKTTVITLDSIADNYLDEYSNLFIKIDTQGYERNVLDGAFKTLKKARGILCELSLTPLYDGQDNWIDLILRLEKEGFILWSLERGFTDIPDGRTLQVDGVFLKKIFN